MYSKRATFDISFADLTDFSRFIPRPLRRWDESASVVRYGFGFFNIRLTSQAVISYTAYSDLISHIAVSLKKLSKSGKKVLSKDDDKIMTKTGQWNRKFCTRSAGNAGLEGVVYVCLCVRSLWKSFRTDVCLCRRFPAHIFTDFV